MQCHTSQCSVEQFSPEQRSAFSAVQCSGEQCSTVQSSEVQSSAGQFRAVKCISVQYRAKQYSAEQCRAERHIWVRSGEGDHDHPQATRQQHLKVVRVQTTHISRWQFPCLWYINTPNWRMWTFCPGSHL